MARNGGKTYDGGVASTQLEILIARLKDHQDALTALHRSIALEENKSSYPDSDRPSIDEGSKKALELKEKKLEIENEIGTDLNLGRFTYLIAQATTEIITLAGKFDELAGLWPLPPKPKH